MDNSSYTGDLPVVVADEPSMYGAIVVTGLPMGEDRRVIDVKLERDTDVFKLQTVLAEYILNRYMGMRIDG